MKYVGIFYKICFAIVFVENTYFCAPYIMYSIEMYDDVH